MFFLGAEDRAFDPNGFPWGRARKSHGVYVLRRRRKVNQQTVGKYVDRDTTISGLRNYTQLGREMLGTDFGLAFQNRRFILLFLIASDNIIPIILADVRGEGVQRGRS